MEVQLQGSSLSVGTVGVALGMASMADGPLGGSSYIEMCCKGMERV